MAQFNFSCPHCHQLVQGDDQWTGQPIQCPACAGEIIVPQNAAASAPPPPPPAPAPPAGQPQKPVSKLKVNAAPHAPAPPPPSQPSPMSRPAYSPPKPKNSGAAAMWIKTAVIVLVIGVGFYFAFPYMRKWQAGLSESNDDASGVGGQVSHINALNDVLDRTEPGHMGMSSKEAAAAERQEKRMKARLEAQEKQQQKAGGAAPSEVGNAVIKATAEMASLPLASGVWSTDTETNIPEGRANGMISGTNFVVDTAQLVKVGPTQILTLREGTNTDRGLFVTFQLTAGEELAGHTWSISPEMKGKGVPNVIKRWKPNPRFAPSKKAFATGYAMQLEFGQPTNGIIAGKISVSLPDPEQSYVVGAFKAALMTPGAN